MRAGSSIGQSARRGRGWEAWVSVPGLRRDDGRNARSRIGGSSRGARRLPVAGVRFGLALGALLHAGCDRAGPTEPLAPAAAAGTTHSPATATIATSHDADVAIEWLRLSFELTRAEALVPPVAARAYAYTGVTLWEAVVPGVVGGQSLAGQLNGLAALPAAAQDLHWPTVLNAAAAAITHRFYTSGRSTAAIRQLEHRFQNRFRGAIPGQQFGRSVAHGQRVANAIWQWSRTDGFRQLDDCPYTPPTGPGMWTPTPPDFEAPVQPCWGSLRPFVLRAAGDCAPPLHPAYSEDPGSEFHQEAIEVYDVVRNLTAEQRTIALYWADLAGESATPAGHSLSITAQVLEQIDAPLDVAAEAFAKVGIGESDAFIACWATKYHYNLLRPVTWIQKVVDLAWEPLLDTPPFPAYTSGHSNDAGASSMILTALFGDAFAFTDHTNDDRGFAPRSFGSFFEAANESAISRLYGGIHYRSDIEQGLAQGQCIGRAVNALVFGTPALVATSGGD